MMITYSLSILPVLAANQPPILLNGSCFDFPKIFACSAPSTKMPDLIER